MKSAFESGAFRGGAFTVSAGSSILTPFNTVQRANMLAEWRADSVAGADGSLVSSWQDQTSNGNTLAQSTTGFKPFIWANAKGTHQAIAFDGIDDRLTCALPFTGSACTILATIADKGTHTGGICGMINSGNGNDAASLTSFLPLFCNSTNFSTWRNNGNLGSSSMSAATPYVLAVRIAANGNVKMCVNATAVTGALASGAFAWANLAVGARYSTGVANFLDVQLLNLCIYNYDLSDTDLTSATNAINSHYSIF